MNNNTDSNFLSLVCLGDVVGLPGREALKLAIKQIELDLKPNLLIVNCENASGGLGLDAKCAKELLQAGVNVITLGDHVWRRKDLYSSLNNLDTVIRPANFPDGCPGKGYVKLDVAGYKVAVINLLGRVFIQALVDCPFQTTEKLLNNELEDCDLIICDFHAEATSEKAAYANHFDGRLSLVFGTHTHVTTADERVLANGTGFITDLGMSGPTDSVIGMKKEVAIKRFLTAMPHSYEVGAGEVKVSGIHTTFLDGKIQTLKRISY